MSTRGLERVPIQLGSARVNAGVLKAWPMATGKSAAIDLLPPPPPPPIEGPASTVAPPARPSAAKPVATSPIAAPPVAPRPVAVKPLAASPVATKPVVTEPVAAQL